MSSGHQGKVEKKDIITMYKRLYKKIVSIFEIFHPYLGKHVVKLELKIEGFIQQKLRKLIILH